MKTTVRIISLLICLTMLIAVCACGGDKEASGDPEKTEASAVAPSPEGTVTDAPTDAPKITSGNDNVIDLTYEPVFTDVPVITDSPDGFVTAGPTATPPVTDRPAASPAVTSAPGITPAPGITSAPSQTEPASHTSAPAHTEAAPGETPVVPHPDEPNDQTAVYEGEIIDLSDLQPGDTFYWTLTLGNAHSSLYAGLWLVEFPSKYLTPVSSTDLWEGSLKYIIDEAYDNDEPDSDRPEFMFNIDYEGQTGSNPYGEAGKRYTLIGMYITSFDHCGVQAQGPMIRIRYRLERIPSRSSMEHDENGYYIPLRLTVQNSAALLPDGQTVTHGHIETVDGKLYFGH